MNLMQWTDTKLNEEGYYFRHGMQSCVTGNTFKYGHILTLTCLNSTMQASFYIKRFMSISDIEHTNTAKRCKPWCHSGKNALTSLLTVWRSHVHHTLLCPMYTSKSE